MIHFIVHAENDNVGVAVTDLTAGQVLTGWNMLSDATLMAEAINEIPLGHKIALTDVSEQEAIVKYNLPIGKATRGIAKGEHVHTHNLKTARW